MLMDTLNRILMVLFFMSFLNTARHLYYFVQTMMISNEENIVKYKLDKKSLFLLGVSVSYILTVVFKGINL
jgi:hypothetical protein